MDLNEVNQFIKESPISICIGGSYDVDIELVIKAFEHWQKTGYNAINEHQSLTFIKQYGWCDGFNVKNEDIILMENCLDNKTFWSYSLFFKNKKELKEIYLYSLSKRR